MMPPYLGYFGGVYEDSLFFGCKMTPALTKQMIAENVEIGDIRWSAENLAKKTNGIYMPCDGGLINPYAYPDLCNTIGAKYGISVSYTDYGYDATTDYDTAYFEHTAALGVSPVDATCTLASYIYDGGLYIANGSNDLVYLHGRRRSEPVICFYLSNIPIIVYFYQSSNTVPRYVAFVNYYKPTNIVNTNIVVTDTSTQLFYSAYVASTYALVYVGSYVFRITCADKTSVPIVTATNLSSMISLGNNSSPVCINGDLYYKEHVSDKWRVYRYNTNSIEDVTDTTALTSLNAFSLPFSENLSTAITYGDGFIARGNGKILFFDKETGTITGSKKLNFINTASGEFIDNVPILLPSNAISKIGNTLIALYSLSISAGNSSYVYAGGVKDLDVLLVENPLTANINMTTSSFGRTFVYAPNFSLSSIPIILFRRSGSGSNEKRHLGHGELLIHNYVRLPLAKIGTPSSLTTPFVKVKK